MRVGNAVGGIFPIEPVMPATVKFFGRYKGGAIRDGVVIAIGNVRAPQLPAWSCDRDEVMAACDADR